MAVTIRKAEKHDCTRLLELVKELAIYERAPEEVTVTLQHFEESGFGERPVWWSLVAEESNVIVGFVLYYIRFSTWKGQRMYLEDFVVTDTARGIGTGMLLFKALMEEAKEKNLSGIMWQVLDWNEPALNFYRKLNAKITGEWLNCSIELQ